MEAPVRAVLHDWCRAVTGGPVPIEMADAGQRHAVQEFGVLVFEIERLGRKHQEEPGAEEQHQRDAAPAAGDRLQAEERAFGRGHVASFIPTCRAGQPCMATLSAGAWSRSFMP